MGGILKAAGAVMKNFTEVNKELGQVGNYTNGAAFNASLLNFAFFTLYFSVVPSS
jgi:hypothetical protein